MVLMVETEKDRRRPSVFVKELFHNLLLGSARLPLLLGRYTEHYGCTAS